MNEQILKLIYDYSNNGKLADKNFIEQIVKIVCEYENISKYIKNIEFKPINSQDNSSIAGYNYKEKKIILFYEQLNKYLNTKKSSDVFISSSEKIFYKNVEIVDSILHELEHAKQSKVMETESNLESSILKITGVGKSRELFEAQLRKMGYGNALVNIFLEEKMKNYYKYYNFAPHERLAEINAHSKMADIIYPIKNFIPNIYKLENIFIVRNKLKGYTLDNKLISPTVYYLRNQNEEVNLNKFSWYDKNEDKCLVLSKNLYNTEKRINLGLPIDSIEYSRLNRDYNKLVKSL